MSVAKRKFAPFEDELLNGLVKQYGENRWESIASLMPNRNPRQCKNRWEYYLSPSIRNEPWTDEDEKMLANIVKDMRYRWVNISRKFPGRTDTQIKNKWNTIKRQSAKNKLDSVPSVSGGSSNQKIFEKEENTISRQGTYVTACDESSSSNSNKDNPNREIDDTCSSFKKGSGSGSPLQSSDFSFPNDQDMGNDFI